MASVLWAKFRHDPHFIDGELPTYPPSPVLDQDLSPGHQAQTPATWAYLNFSESDSVPLSQASRVASVGSEMDRVHRHRKSRGQHCSGLSALLQPPMTC